MKKIKIGVLCPSEIALRRFMPALEQLEEFEYVGIAAAAESEWICCSDFSLDTELKKAKEFQTKYKGKIFSSYTELVTSGEIEAVYIPLPPALHFKWAKLALENNKHVFLEKPFTTSLTDTKKLIEIATKKELALHENYMFAFHSQLNFIKNKITNGEIGDIRLIRIDFGFPFRGKNDFRYNNSLGGGALLDCGGYTLKLATMLLGDTAKVTASQLNSKDGFEVDIYGTATLINDSGLTAQISFGMDNSYRCSLDIWGSNGTIYTNRILTAPACYQPIVKISNAEFEKDYVIDADDTFKKSIEKFMSCINNDETRLSNYNSILHQSTLVEKVKGE